MRMVREEENGSLYSRFRTRNIVEKMMTSAADSTHIEIIPA